MSCRNLVQSLGRTVLLLPIAFESQEVIDTPRRGCVVRLSASQQEMRATCAVHLTEISDGREYAKVEKALIVENASDSLR